MVGQKQDSRSTLGRTAAVHKVIGIAIKEILVNSHLELLDDSNASLCQLSSQSLEDTFGLVPEVGGGGRQSP